MKNRGMRHANTSVSGDATPAAADEYGEKLEPDTAHSRHCGLWKEASPMAAPKEPEPEFLQESALDYPAPP